MDLMSAAWRAQVEKPDGGGIPGRPEQIRELPWLDCWTSLPAFLVFHPVFRVLDIT
jgi:hypothetical protein